jgi:hypothetical protein
MSPPFSKQSQGETRMSQDASRTGSGSDDANDDEVQPAVQDLPYRQQQQRQRTPQARQDTRPAKDDGGQPPPLFKGSEGEEEKNLFFSPQ